MKYPNLIKLRLGFPTTTQLRDGLIRRKGFPVSTADASLLETRHALSVQFGLTQHPQAAVRLPQTEFLILQADWHGHMQDPAAYLISRPLLSTFIPCR